MTGSASAGPGGMLSPGKRSCGWWVSRHSAGQPASVPTGSGGWHAASIDTSPYLINKLRRVESGSVPACHRVWARWQAVSVCGRRRSALQDINWLELAAEDILAADAKPLIEDGGVHLAEVGVMHQVVTRYLPQVRMRPDQPRLDLAANQEHRRCRAVVGAATAVLLGPPAELGERHHEQPVLVAACRQVLEECRHRCRELLQQVSVGSRLLGVRVEALQRDVEEASAEVAVDELGRQLELVRQGRLRVGRLRLVVLADLLKSAAAGVGVGGGTLHEVEQARLPRAARLRRPLDDLALGLRVGTAGDLQLEVLKRGDRRHARRGTVQRQRRALAAALEMERWRRRHLLQRLADPALGEVLGG